MWDCIELTFLLSRRVVSIPSSSPEVAVIKPDNTYSVRGVFDRYKHCEVDVLDHMKEM